MWFSDAQTISRSVHCLSKVEPTCTIPGRVRAILASTRIHLSASTSLTIPSPKVVKQVPLHLDLDQLN